MAESTTIKACCAALYASEWAQWLLGDSFHPGGLALTERLGTLLQLRAGQRVLDVAAGNGASAIYLVQRFGCTMVGLDYSASMMAGVQIAAARADVAERVTFQPGDAEALPFGDSEFDAVICECAFCTFPDKRAAAAEFARVLRRGGCLGLSDLTRAGPLPRELETLLAWIACIADAQSLNQYIAYLESAALAITHTEAHDDALSEMVSSIRTKLLGAELLVKLNKLDLPNVDFAQAKQLARAATEAIRGGTLGYGLLVAKKPTR